MNSQINQKNAISGCLLGCAIGDSICLPYEGMSPKRIRKIVRMPLKHHFFIGHGMVSDDTDHSLFVAQSLAINTTDPDKFARALAWRFRFWLLCVPAGIGLATLRSIVRLWFGVPFSKSGVYSAGNGAAMRSAIIGVVHCDNSELRQRFITASTRITHTDPKAEYGAQAVAGISAYVTRNGSKPTVPELEKILLDSGEGDEWNETVEKTIAACRSGKIEYAITPKGIKRGISGYILHTLPVAVAAWHLHFGNFRKTIETVVQLGGDTDTVAAIAGSLAGITCSKENIPEDWISGIIDRPHSVQYIYCLAENLNTGQTPNAEFSWLLIPRGIFFTFVVLGHGFRRLFPPY
jgi:ADP-ribosyl-[dinitrogen reductase] hydrolase